MRWWGIRKVPAGVFPGVLTVALAAAISTLRPMERLCPLLPWGAGAECGSRAMLEAPLQADRGGEAARVPAVGLALQRG